MKTVFLILNELSDRDIDWLLEVSRRETIPAGSVLIQEGQSVDTLYVLLEGTLVVSISALEGKQIAQLSSGELVGEMSFLDSRPPSATVKTLEDSLVLAVPRSQLSAKLQNDEGFGCRFYRALAMLLSHRLRGTVQKLGDSNQLASTPSANQVNGAIARARFERLLNR